MADTFNTDPGEGWREVTYEQWRSDDCPPPKDCAYLRIGAAEDHYYWREAPVPPLPTEPWTTFRTAHTDRGTATWLRHSNGTLLAVHSGEFWHEDPKDVTGFEVLAEPRAVTAKAVIDRVTELVDAEDSVFTIGMYDTLVAEFGVGS